MPPGVPGNESRRSCADGSVRTVALANLGPYTLAWDDNPANWVAGRWLEQRRDFLNGPLRSLNARLAFAADGAGSLSAFTPRPRCLRTRSGT